MPARSQTQWRLRHKTEKKALAGDIRDKYLEAKGVGFDVKILRKVVARRKKAESTVKEEDALIAVYLHAMETPLEAHIREAQEMEEVGASH